MPSSPEEITDLQQSLHEKAEANPTYRFYALYDKLYRQDVLRYAWKCCRANGGRPGVDGISFAQIDRAGPELWLQTVAEELRAKTYRPKPVLQMRVPMSNGRQMLLEIPTIKDRVVQMAATIVLSPIFEADLHAEKYAYRPRTSARASIRGATHRWVGRGYCEVPEADLNGYYDTIPYVELIKSLARRISVVWRIGDAAMLKLLRMWLLIPVEESVRREDTTARRRGLAFHRQVG